MAETARALALAQAPPLDSPSCCSLVPTLLGPEALLSFRLKQPLTVSTTRSQQAFLPVGPNDYSSPSLRRRDDAYVAYPPAYYAPYYAACGPYGCAPYYSYGYPGFGFAYYGEYGYHGGFGHGVHR